MRKIFNKAFVVGFLSAALSFAIFTAMTYTLESETRLRNRVNTVGFPFAYYEWGGDPYFERVVVSGLLADLAIVLVYSMIVGIVFSFIWRIQTRIESNQ